jgi:hypothetical protein
MKNLLSMHTLRDSVLALALAAAPATSFAAVFISARFPPPPIPVYTQPLCPGDGYLWNPGYWFYGPDGYFWVPGVWVMPAEYGLVWTPGYWGWGGSAFLFHEGYWGQHVGFYGGINYGFGYWGSGFTGGRWEGKNFLYNTAVVNVNRSVVHNVYVEKVPVANAGVRTSFNGGAGGIEARPTAEESQWEHENRFAATVEQRNHVELAHTDRANFASANDGRPAHLTAMTVNNYRSTTLLVNNHNATNNTQSNIRTVTNNDPHTTTNNTNYGNHEAAANNRPEPQSGSQSRSAPSPQPAPQARPVPGPQPKP